MEKYLPYYPDIDLESFYQNLMEKFEFSPNSSSNGIGMDDNNEGLFFPYQNNIARFLSAKTIYNSLLLIHEMGTGKSGSAIATAHLVRGQDSSFKKTIVLANGKTQLNNFRYEIMNRLPFLYDKHKDTKDVKVILRREGFFFETYRIFSKSLQSKQPADIRRIYENSIIVMDEIHNITASVKTAEVTTSAGDRFLTNVQTYQILYEFVHTLKNRKLLCLTGTPIRDKPQEIAKVLNMVLPRQNKFPIGDDFKNSYLRVVKTVDVLGDAKLTLYDFKEEKLPQFLENVKGYVSYLKKSVPDNITIDYRTNPDFQQTGLEHFKVFANIMKEPQNAIYIDDFVEDLERNVKGTSVNEETGEEEEEENIEKRMSSLAYSKSKQSSLMVFPERANVALYVTPVFEKVTDRGVVKQGKHLKTIGWTKEMRILFPRSLSLEDKLERLSRYSCIYSKIVREIVFNPSELVYIYSFLKAGSGIYVLASFLVEYFGFEIVRHLADVRTKATTKRRLLILNHDFVSDNDLREMVDFFNKEGNALAEYIQVVIGTKQTKEGITLKNIRQIHVVQPEWNYADISQAIARGIRVNSHEALLRKISPITVSVFQHVAVPLIDKEADVEYSIDVDQYHRSEIKDMNIKMIERQLIVSSWDCFLNQTRNTGTSDYTRECEYQKCKYTCRGIPPNFVPKYDFGTYNTYYSRVPQILLKDKITDVFKTSDSIILSDLLTRIQTEDSNTDLVKQVLEEMVMNCTDMMNRRLDRTFLKTSRVYGIQGSAKGFVDMYYLVPEFNQYKVYDMLYNTTPIFSIPSPFMNVNSHFYQWRFASIVRVIMDMFYASTDEQDTRDRCRALILQSPLFLQQLLVEMILLVQSQEDNQQPEFFDFVLTHYINQARLEKVENVYISTLLPDKKRELDMSVQPLTWKSVEMTEVEETDAEESNEFIKKFITENVYKYYGIVEVSKDKTVFKIRDVRDQELVFGTNKAKVPKGEVCAGSFSRKKSGLIDILLALEWKPEAESIRNLPTIEKIKEVLSTKDKDRLWRDIGNEMANIDEDTLRTIYILNLEKIPNLCGLVKKRFTDLDLIHTKRV